MKKLTVMLATTAAAALAASAAQAERGSDGQLNILYWQAPSTQNPHGTPCTLNPHVPPGCTTNALPWIVAARAIGSPALVLRS